MGSKTPSSGSSAFLAVAVRLPPEMVGEVDAMVGEIQGAAPGVRVSRSDAIRILLGEALSARRKVRNGGLRERVLQLVRSRGGAVALADIREELVDVSRDALEGVLLELDAEGQLRLRGAEGELSARVRGAAFRDSTRGELVYATLPVP